MYLDRLTAAHQGDAELTLRSLVAYDGTNDPIVTTENQSLPAVTDAERFTLGPIDIESVTLTQFRSLEIDFGVDAVSEGSESEIWDRYPNIRAIKPVITISGISLAWMAAAAVPFDGLDITHLNTAIYLRKRAAGGTFELDATVEHIKFTAAGLAYVSEPYNASGVDAAEVTIRIPLRYDGTNAPLVIDTTSAIT
jgi:hypothetical protein